MKDMKLFYRSVDHMFGTNVALRVTRFADSTCESKVCMVHLRDGKSKHHPTKVYNAHDVLAEVERHILLPRKRWVSQETSDTALHKLKEWLTQYIEEYDNYKYVTYDVEETYEIPYSTASYIRQREIRVAGKELRRLDFVRRWDETFKPS